MPRMRFAFLLMMIPLCSCNCAPPPPPEGALCGTGTVDLSPYAIDPAATRLIIVVLRNDGAGCGVFHNHVVSAKAATVEYTIDGQTPGNSTVTVTVAASGLDADDDALRDEFLTAAGKDGRHLSDGDRASIRGSVGDEVLAAANPKLTFTIKNLSATVGAGTAKMTAALAGATSDVDVQYTVVKDGDTLTIKDGTATLEGAPYGIPRNSLGFCVNASMSVHFDLKLVKVAATPVCQLGPGDAYIPQDFGDPACAPTVSYNEAREVAVKRCAGCHAAELRLGATVPLIEWQDWQHDSVRNQGQALYTTAHDYIHLSPTQGLSMPPQDPIESLATPLTAPEIQLFDDWVADGARNTKCANDPGPTVFPSVASVACSNTTNYFTDDGAGNTPQAFFENFCGYCHLDAGNLYPGVPQIGVAGGTVDPVTGNVQLDPARAQAGVLHPYYQGNAGALSFWEASVLRVADGSMPPRYITGDPAGPYGLYTQTCTGDLDCADPTPSCVQNVCVDAGFKAFADWVSAGFAPDVCP